MRHGRARSSLRVTGWGRLRVCFKAVEPLERQCPSLADSKHLAWMACACPVGEGRVVARWRTNHKFARQLPHRALQNADTKQAADRMKTP